MEIPYHDAKLVSIRIEKSGDIALSFVSVTNRKFATVLRGIQHFCCDNFREGNTIFERRVDDTKKVRSEDLEKLMFARPGDDSNRIIFVEKAIESGKFVFFKLVASYGANILAVCERVEESVDQ